MAGNSCGVIVTCLWVRGVVELAVNHTNLAPHCEFWPLSNCSECLCIWWLYFHVPSNQFLYVSHFVILLKAKLEEQAVCKSCDIADFLSVLEKNDNTSSTNGVTLPTDSIAEPENISVGAMKSVRSRNN